MKPKPHRQPLARDRRLPARDAIHHDAGDVKGAMCNDFLSAVPQSILLHSQTGTRQRRKAPGDHNVRVMSAGAPRAVTMFLPVPPNRLAAFSRAPSVYEAPARRIHKSVIAARPVTDKLPVIANACRILNVR